MKHAPSGDLTPDQQRAREALRELPVPAAEPAFRARLKHDFASGQIGERRSLELSTPWTRRRWLRWATVPVAAVVLIAVVSALNQPPSWRVAAVAGGGTALVNGTPVPLSPAAIERRLEPGARVRLPGTASVTLASAGRMLLELTPGTELTLPEAPGRWFGRAGHSKLARGELHVTTGRAFHGAHLGIETAEARIEVTGTTFAVLCLPVGTCVCVYEGTVRVGDRRGQWASVAAGRRREVFKDGRSPLDDAMLVHEHGNLARLAAQRATLLR